SRYLTAQSASYLVNLYSQLYADIVNPPNPALRWEKIRNLNLGLEMSLLDDRINLEIEKWQKDGRDLISKIDVAPQLGLTSFTGNAEYTSFECFYLSVNTKNVRTDILNWDTFLIVSKIKNIVNEIFIEAGSNYNVVSSPAQNLIEGRPYWSIHSFPYK